MNINTINNLARTSRVFKKTLLVSAVLSALSATTLQAQESDAVEAEEEFERIFVTASKRTTGLQETPVAIQVVSGEAIEQANLADINDLQVLVPTLRVAPLERSSNVTFSLRGFGNGANNTGIEPSVGIFIDGVYRSRAGGAIGDLPRVSQIEVLSGPQSTLFGKNASAGVISVRTLEPSYDLEGKVEAGIGNYNNRLVKGYVTNGITDNLAYSLSGGFNTRDGFTESISNVEGIKDLNDKDRWNLRGQMLYEPTEDVKVRFIADYSEISEICCTVAAAINGPTTGASQAVGGGGFSGSIVLDDADPFAYESALTTSPTNDVEDGGVSVQVDVDFENFAFTSILAYRTNEVLTGDIDGVGETHDIDYNSSDVLGRSTRTDIETSTQEFRLTSTGESTLDWMVGAFFFQEEVELNERLTFGEDARAFIDLLIGGGVPGTFSTVEAAIGLPDGFAYSAGSKINEDFTQDNDAYSIFGNFDYHLSDDLTATLGLAYTNDEKEITALQPLNEASFSALQLPDFLGGIKAVQFLPPVIDLPNSVEDNSTSDSKTTYSVRLAYTLNNNVNFFATAATGFKATSWNLSRDSRPFASDEAALVTAGLTQPNQTYGTRYASPELATVYEVGMKSRFKKGGLNVTIFDQTIEGFQSSTFQGSGFVLANAGEQSTTGIEFDSVYRPFDDWTLTLAGIFLDPVFDSFVGASAVGGGTIDLSGTKPAGIHEQSITAGIVYNYELDNGMYGYVRTDYIYESEVRLVSNLPDSLTREVSTFNASAGLNFENGVMLQLYVRNLTNDEYFLSGFPPPTQTGSFSVYPNQPRTFGVNVSYEFY